VSYTTPVEGACGRLVFIFTKNSDFGFGKIKPVTPTSNNKHTLSEHCNLQILAFERPGCPKTMSKRWEACAPQPFGRGCGAHGPAKTSEIEDDHDVLSLRHYPPGRVLVSSGWSVGGKGYGVGEYPPLSPFTGNPRAWPWPKPHPQGIAQISKAFRAFIGTPNVHDLPHSQVFFSQQPELTRLHKVKLVLPRDNDRA
jgi:hypothetical protein